MQNWKVAYENEFFQGKALLFKDLDLNKRFKNEIENNKEKYAVNSASPIRTKSIFRPMVLPETTRQRGS